MWSLRRRAASLERAGPCSPRHERCHTARSTVMCGIEAETRACRGRIAALRRILDAGWFWRAEPSDRRGSWRRASRADLRGFSGSDAMVTCPRQASRARARETPGHRQRSLRRRQQHARPPDQLSFTGVGALAPGALDTGHAALGIALGHVEYCWCQGHRARDRQHRSVPESACAHVGRTHRDGVNRLGSLLLARASVEVPGSRARPVPGDVVGRLDLEHGVLRLVVPRLGGSHQEKASCGDAVRRAAAALHVRLVAQGGQRPVATGRCPAVAALPAAAARRDPRKIHQRPYTSSGMWRLADRRRACRQRRWCPFSASRLRGLGLLGGRGRRGASARQGEEHCSSGRRTDLSTGLREARGNDVAVEQLGLARFCAAIARPPCASPRTRASGITSRRCWA